MFYLWKKSSALRLPQTLPTRKQPNVGGTQLPKRLQVDPIEGYRTWRIQLDDEGRFGLWSLMMTYEWDEYNTAECKAGPFVIHDTPAPAATCSCGFYVQKPNHPLGEWEAHVRGRVRANGQTALSGRVIVCDYGYKAEHANIISPVFIDVDCTKKGCMNPVTRIRVGGTTDFWGFCDEHEADHQNAVLVPAELWMRECIRQLNDRYPNIEFLTFMEV